MVIKWRRKTNIGRIQENIILHIKGLTIVIAKNNIKLHLGCHHWGQFLLYTQVDTELYYIISAACGEPLLHVFTQKQVKTSEIMSPARVNNGSKDKTHSSCVLLDDSNIKKKKNWEDETEILERSD